MIQQIVALALKFRIMVIGSAAVVMALAAAQLPAAPVQALPEFSPTRVEIQVEALGLSAAEVEQLITIPMEHLLGGVAWVDQIESESVPGLSTIDLNFHSGIPLLKARQVVLERLGRADTLPNVGSPPVMIQPLSSQSRVMMVGLKSKDLSLVDLSILARWKIKPRLMGVPGVANVAIWGFRDRQLQVQVDPDRLRKNGVTLSQIINSTGNALWVSPLTFIAASTPGTGGFIDTATQRFTIQHVLPITTASDLSAVIIEGTGARTIRLGEVTTVVEDHQALIGDALLADGQPGLMLVVQKFPGASTSDVTKGVKDALDSMQPGLPSVAIDTSIYQSQAFAQKALLNVGLLAGGGLLLVLVLLLLFVSWRVALISFVTIVLTLVAATYAMFLVGSNLTTWLNGSTLDMLVLAGLAVALTVVVGDALVDVINIRRRLRQHRVSGGAPPSMASVVTGASSSTRGPLAYATLILLIAPLPLLFLGGVAGSFSRPAVLAYLLAVLLSMVVAVSVTPAMAYVLLASEPIKGRPAPLSRWVGLLFDRVLPRLVLQARWAYVTVAVLVLAICAVVPQLSGQSLLPLPRDRTLLVHFDTASGTSLTEMERVAASAMADLRAVPGVRQVTATIGRAITGDLTVNVNSGQVWINLTDSADYDSTVVAVGRVLRGYPGVHTQVMTYTQDRLQAAQSGANTALAGTPSDIVVRVYGKDLTVLRAKAEQVRQRISQVDGVVGAKVQTENVEPTLEVQVNLAAAQRYGLNPGDVRRAATTYYAGLLVGNLYDDQKVVDVMVQGTPKTQANTNLADLLVDTPAGSLVRLGDVASVRVVPFPTIIRHSAASRSLDVTANVNGRDLGSVLSDIKYQVLTVQMPTEYHAEVFSDLAAQQGGELRLTGLAIGVVVAVLLLLQAAFGSWRMAGLLVLTLPLACAGGVVSAYFAGGVMTLGAVMGFFALLGIAVRHSILLIRSYQSLESINGTSKRLDVVLSATRKNAGPIMLAAGATTAALLPVLLFGTVAGTEVLFPLAAVVVGGLVSSTLFTLVLVPTMYLGFAPAPAHDVVSTAPVNGSTNGSPVEVPVGASRANGEIE
jgi:Cu/Ag efflux pump CusA